MEGEAVASRTITVGTFQKWSLGEIIGYHIKEGKVSLVWCKVCARHADKLYKDPRFRGQAAKELDKYISGTCFVTKHSVFRHINSKGHSAALGYQQLLGTDNTDETNNTSPSIPKQPKIDSVIQKASKDAYLKLFKSAYLLAVDGLPLAHFRTLVNVQKCNGVKLVTKCDNSRKAREFIHDIADSMRRKIGDLVKSGTCFSLLTDGSQPRKTGSEKELVLIRVVRDGKPFFLCAAVQDMDDYGNANADNLKTSIDDVFGENQKSKIRIAADQYTKKLVSFTSDGASVNTGKHNGLLTQMKADGRDWLVSVHCVLHRVELAIKDSLRKIPEFTKANDLMVTIFYMFKQSGKLKRHFYSMAKVLGVHVFNFPKVHGTRFVSHQRRGLQHLLHNWTVLCQTLEDCIENNKVSTMTVKMRGVLKKLKDFSFLSVCTLYLQILDKLSQMSLTMETGDIIVTEILPAIEKTKLRLEELTTLEYEETGDFVKPFGFTLRQTEQGTPGSEEYTIEQTLPCSGHTKMKAENREFVNISITGMMYVQKATTSINRIKPKALTDVYRCLDERFASFKSPIFTHMNWLDPANWCNAERELTSLLFIAEHFKETLMLGGGFDSSKLRTEWKDIQLTVKHFYQGVKAKELWSKILIYRKTEFPNVCKLVEILLCVGPSNGLVESAFSHLNSMMSDRRLNLCHSTMEDLLLIKVNDLSFSDGDREEIINSALVNYMCKSRRKSKMHTGSLSLMSRGAEEKINRKRNSHYAWNHNDTSASASASISSTVEIESIRI